MPYAELEPTTFGNKIATVAVSVSRPRHLESHKNLNVGLFLYLFSEIPSATLVLHPRMIG